MPKYVVNNVQDGCGSVYKKFVFNDTLTSEFQTPKQKSCKKCVLLTVMILVCFTFLVLAGWFVYSAFFNVVPDWQKDNFIIESIPGLRYRPKPPDISSRGTLILYNASDDCEWKKWVKIIDNFLQDYKNADLIPGNGRNTVYCDEESSLGDKVCYVDPEEWAPCSQETQYYYPTRSPCVFLKLNQAYNFTPEFYNDTSRLPEDMPQDLKRYIDTIEPEKRNTVWVSCEGENPADMEMRGDIEYPGERGFPGYFFPFTYQKDYLSPLVAVRFMNPTIGVLINVECRVWAKNVKYDRQRGTGLVHFELMVE